VISHQRASGEKVDDIVPVVAELALRFRHSLEIPSRLSKARIASFCDAIDRPTHADVGRDWTMIGCATIPSGRIFHRGAFTAGAANASTNADRSR
jgi:hypothetical protein